MSVSKTSSPGKETCVVVPVKNAAGKLVCRADLQAQRIEISHHGQIVQVWFDAQGVLHTHQMISGKNHEPNRPPPLGDVAG